ncbi:MAG: hypothetical protein ACPHER_08270, partial [Nevskiales bacterium]
MFSLSLLAGLLLLTLVVLSSLDDISRRDSHFGRMLLALIAIGLLHLSWELRRRGVQLVWPWANQQANKKAGIASQALYGLLLLTATYACFNYYQFDRKVFGSVGDYADATYYYLNSKYFEELGYTRLYEAMLIADAEADKRFRNVRRYRDLVAYKDVLPRAIALQHSRQIKAHFPAQRWESFRSDVQYIAAHNISGGWNYFFIDHGYNPPPTWSLVGGSFAKLCPVEHLKWITMIDFVLIVSMMLVIGRVFGSYALLIALLFYCVTFSGRWPILGQSLLRFDWLVALVLAVAALKKARFTLAGALLAYAACNRIFPAIFF